MNVGLYVMITPVEGFSLFFFICVNNFYVFRRTMQQSVKGLACTEDCHGRMVQEYSESSLYTQLKYFESLFDIGKYQSKHALTDTQ
jgi:hypothetical protein